MPSVEQTRPPGADVGAPRPAPEAGIARWIDLMHVSEQFLLAGLRRKIGPDGDLQAAHAEWYARQMEEHDRMMIHLVRQLDRRCRSHDR